MASKRNAKIREPYYFKLSINTFYNSCYYLDLLHFLYFIDHFEKAQRTISFDFKPIIIVLYTIFALWSDLK